MNKTKIALACASAMALSLGSAQLLAQGQPKVYGEVGAHVISQDENDLATEATSAVLGVKGMGRHNGVTAVYELEVDFANAANHTSDVPDDENEAQVSSARLIFPTSYGSFVVAPKTPSSQFSVLYGAVDIFETNSANAGNGVSTIFEQGDTSTHVLAYQTPVFGGAKALVAHLTSDDKTQDEDMDILTWWLEWQAPTETAAEGLRLAAGQVYFAEAVPNSALAGSALAGQGEEWTRTAFSAEYSLESFHLGFTYEDYARNDTDFGQASLASVTSMGLAGSYTYDSYTLGVGYYDRDSEIDTDDNNGVVVSVKKQVDENLLLYAENGTFDQDGQSSFSLGAKLSF
ncbi:hypothetical protein [Marinospirillum sp.]|uniref:hypothetical protein n=1 Tax=Marinospirillum sp. TaxID=2183934 RepID=UPI00286FC64A|nr:hypothetical protein [Marinospirillum sp.]MDR9468713.1 hypothetical protein [Marinospirillum sp.]